MAERVRTLELQVTQRLDSLLHGAHEGLTPGHGSDLGESRPYVPGDEVRRIDWNVTARTNEVHVRDMIAERELTTWLVVDLDANMDFGTVGTSKADLAAAAIATIGFINVRDSNQLGAMLVAGPHRRPFPPRPGRDHVRAILTAAMQPPAVEGAGHSDLAAALHRVLATQRHRGMIVLVSDLRGGSAGGQSGSGFTDPRGDDPQGAADATGSQQADGLAGRLPDDLAQATLQHDVLVIQVVDQRDIDLPDVGMINLVDPASGRSREVVATPGLRAEYRARAEEFQQRVSHDIRAAGADHLVLQTGQDWLSAIARHVRQRRHLRLPRR